MGVCWGEADEAENSHEATRLNKAGIDPDLIQGEVVNVSPEVQQKSE